MEGISNLLKKLSVEDVEKLKALMSIIPEAASKEIVTLRVFAEEYRILIQNNRSVSYLHSVNIALNYFLEFSGPQTPINSISLKEIESFIMSLKKKVKKGYAVYYRNLKSAFNKAKDWGYVKENYFTKIKLPKMQKLAPIFIDSDELARINEQINNDIVRDFVTIGFYTGMRLNEIVNLKWKNVNLDTRIITVGDEEFTTKGRNQRFIPICDEAMEVLKRRKKVVGGGLLEVEKPENRGQRTDVPARSGTGRSQKAENGDLKAKNRSQKAEGRCQKEESGSQKSGREHEVIVYHIKKDSPEGYVFCKEDGEKFTGDYFSRRFKRACRAAGMDKSIHFHSLRHSFASNLAQQGVSLYVIKELLGHSSVSTTEIYSHLNLETLKEAISVLDGPQEKQAQLSMSKTSGLHLIDQKKME